jgi:cell division protein FtsN
MTSVSLGPYAPQLDELSISNDPSQGRSRHSAPWPLMFSGVILCVLITALFMIYHGVRESGAEPATVERPAIARKAPATIKAAAETKAALDVYVQEAAPAALAAAPTELGEPALPPGSSFTPAAPVPAGQAPALRPQAAPFQTATATPRSAPAPAKSAGAAPLTTAAGSAAPPAQIASASTDDETISTHPVVVMAPAAPTSSATAAARGSGRSRTQADGAALTSPSSGDRFGVQIGAFASRSIADAEYAKVAGSLGGSGKTVTLVDKNGSKFYRTVVTGFTSKTEAEAACAKLKASARACFVRRV